MLLVAMLATAKYAQASACARLLGAAWARDRRAAVIETANSAQPWGGSGEEGPTLVALLSPAGRAEAVRALAESHDATVVVCDKALPVEVGLIVVPCEPLAQAVGRAAQAVAALHRPNTPARLLRVSEPGTSWDSLTRPSVSKLGIVPFRIQLSEPEAMARALGEVESLQAAHLAEEIDALAAAGPQKAPADQRAFETSVVSFVADIARSVTEMTTLPDGAWAKGAGPARMRLMVNVEQLRSLLGLQFQNGETFCIADSQRFLRTAEATEEAMAEVDQLLAEMADRRQSTAQVPSLPLLLDKLRGLVDEMRSLRNLG
jgi:hypothetical protein